MEGRTELLVILVGGGGTHGSLGVDAELLERLFDVFAGDLVGH